MAIENFSKAIALEPDADRFYRNRAATYTNLKSYGNATAEYRTDRQKVIARYTCSPAAGSMRTVFPTGACRTRSKAYRTTRHAAVVVGGLTSLPAAGSPRTRCAVSSPPAVKAASPLKHRDEYLV